MIRNKLFKQFFILFSFLFFCSGNLFSQGWKQIGITNPADIYEPNAGDMYPYGIGVIWDVRFEPQYDGKQHTRLFATGVSSGLWLSPGGKGNDWKLMNTDFLPETSIGDFAVHPKNRNKIIIGTGLPKLRQSRNRDLFGLPRSKGIFTGTISKKNKVKWKLIPNQLFHEGEIIKDNATFWNEHTKCVAKLRYSNDGSAIILAIIEEETRTKYNTLIYRSLNGGSDWYLKATIPNLFFQDLDFNPTNNDNMVLCCHYDSRFPAHIFESEDLGDTWNPVFTNNEELNVSGAFYKTCFDNSVPSRLWICRCTASENSIFIRKDSMNVTLLQTFRQWHNAGSCSALAVSGYGNDYYSAGSLNLHCAFKGTSQSFNNEMHSDIRAIAYYPKSKNMVVANDGGVSLVSFDSTRNNYNVSDISVGLEIGRITKVSSLSADNFGFANWDNSCRWANPKWKGYKFMDLFGNESVVFDINDSAILDGSAGPTSVVLYTLDSSMQLHQREYYTGDFFTFVPHEKKFFYVTGRQLHRVNYQNESSSDTIVLWHPLLDKTFLQARIAPVNSKIVYTATQQQGTNYQFQLFKSEDGGNNWIELCKQHFDGFLSDIAIDPDHSEKICVASVNGEVFFSENSGLTFSSNTLPAEAGAVNTLTYINSGAVLAACDYGLWIYTKGLLGFREWRKFNDLLPRKAVKLPDCRITDIEYIPSARCIRAATMGRGLFECEIKKLY